MAKNRKTLVTREDVLKRSASEYEALVAIAKEARRLNAVPSLHLKEDEKAIPKAVENFAAGRVQYEVDGTRAGEIPVAEKPKPKPKRRAKKAK